MRVSSVLSNARYFGVAHCGRKGVPARVGYENLGGGRGKGNSGILLYII